MNTMNMSRKCRTGMLCFISAVLDKFPHYVSKEIHRRRLKRVSEPQRKRQMRHRPPREIVEPPELR